MTLSEQDKDYYLNIAKAASEKSTCFIYKEGAVLLNKEGTIISSGYNGAVHGCIDCKANGICTYELTTGNKSDCSQEQCEGLQAGIAAILAAKGNVTEDCTLVIWREDRATGNTEEVTHNGVAARIIQACGIKNIVMSGNS